MNTSLSTTGDDKNTVKTALTVPKSRQTVENKEFAAFAKRILRAYARRVAQGDIEALTDLVAFRNSVDAAINDAVTGLREFGYSWAEIASRLGITKQAAQQKWGLTTTQRPAKPEPLTGQDMLPGLDIPATGSGEQP